MVKEEAENIKIAVRCRPFMRHLKQEHDPALRSVVQMDEENHTVTYVFNPNVPEEDWNHSNERVCHRAAFNYSFWSHNPDDPHYCDQEGVFNTLGMDVYNALQEGYNSSLFAYGQSGSGKTYSMTGGKDEHEGIIPRVCRKLTEDCEVLRSKGELLDYSIFISIVQIYCEEITDLLSTKPGGSGKLKCGNISKQFGWGVPAAERVQVTGYSDIENNLDLCEKRKAVAGTGLNATSSRGHTILTVFYMRTNNANQHIICKMNLIDLAGSERLGKTGATGQQEKEGKAINLSLTTLGNVIRALGKKGARPPYRDSQLTMLLKESLSENSKTVMIAALNPCPANYEETLSTLRFADGVSKVKLPAKKNIQSSAEKKALAAAAQAEIERLQAELLNKTGIEEMNARMIEQMEMMKRELEAYKRDMEMENLTFEERQELARENNRHRIAAAADMGFALGRANDVPDDAIRISSMSEDPILDGRLVYAISSSKPLRIGRRKEKDEEHDMEVLLDGPQVAEFHCEICLENDQCYLTPLYDITDDHFETSMNGKLVREKTSLEQGSRIWIGTSYVFKFFDPSQPPPDFPVNYKMAYTELLKRDGYKDPEEVERELREKTEKLKRELQLRIQREQEEQEAKVLQMRLQFEEQMRSLKELASKEEMEAVEREYQRKQAQMEKERIEMEERLSREREDAISRQERKAREQQLRVDLENEVTEIIPLCRQANLMARDLRRDVHFRARYRQRDDASFSEQSIETMFLNYEVVVEMICEWNGASVFFESGAFRDRVQEMTIVYERVAHALEHGESLEISIDDDPFSVSIGPQCIGRSFIFPLCLSQGLGTSFDDDDPPESTPIFRTDQLAREEECSMIGTLEYRIDVIDSLSDGETEISTYEFEDTIQLDSRLEFQVVVEKIVGLVHSSTYDMWMEFDDFTDCEGSIVRKSSIFSGENNGDVMVFWSEFFEVIVTQKFLDFVLHQPIILKIFGHPEPDLSGPPPMLINVTGSSSTVLPFRKRETLLPLIQGQIMTPRSSAVEMALLSARGGRRSISSLSEVEGLRSSDEASRMNDFDILERDRDRKLMRELEKKLVEGDASGIVDSLLQEIRELKEENQKLRLKNLDQSKFNL